MKRPVETSAPIEAGDCSQVLPEWGGVGDVKDIFGLKRGKTYQLIGTGEIKSAVLRKKGCRTGKRLINLQSVRELLNRNMA